MKVSSRRHRTPECSSYRPLSEVLEQRLLMAAGGGWTSAGLVGEYMVTGNATPMFTRRDVRIDFDWGTVHKPGGSTASQYQAIGTDNYTIRWTGQLLPKYSETYTFKATADDTFKLELKSAGASTWTTVINQTTNTGNVSMGVFAMTAGQKYDVRINYSETTGSAKAKLRWASFSVPEETIDPLQNNMYLVDGRGRYMMADMADDARTSWDNGGGTDANGWLTGQGGLLVWEGATDTNLAGTYEVRFTGRAAVDDDWWNGVKFIPQGSSTQYDSLSMGQGWNSTTNTTQFKMIMPATGNSPFHLNFTNTRRLGTDTTNTGITNLKIMRPRTTGGSNPYPFDAVFTDNFKSASDVFTGFRWLDTNGNLTEKEWADRVKPTYGLGITHQGNGKKGWVYEYQIMFANETGKDLYLTVPMRASNDYFTQLAKLIKYGSDANGNVYSQPTANPAYPPLNPNLRVYVEISNEVWNTAGGFEQTKQADDDAVAAYNSPVGSALKAEWNIINYDNTLPTTDSGGFNSFDQKRYSRWYALRTVRMSEAFRGVYGDSNMGSTVRPLMYWQYNNMWHAVMEPKFLDDYFNNGDGITHVTTPRPMNYYLWGMGGASYYGAGNPRGTMTNDPMTNRGFETGGLPLGVASVRPNITGWSFTGNAGVYGKNGSNYTSDGKTMGALPAPASSSSYAAYVMRGGRISQSITFTASGKYAIGFTARGNNQFPLDAFIGSTRITPEYKIYQGGGEPDPASGPMAITFSWNRDIASAWVDHLTTAVFNVSIPAGQSSVTLTFTIGNYDTSTASDYVLFDNFYLASADAMYNGGIPDDGFALGQPANGQWGTDRKQIAQMAQAYNVNPAVYESGWSLGGDNGTSPFQNYLKFRDPRSRTANNVAIDTHDRSGYGMVTYGVYEQWRDREVDTAANSELRKSFDERNNMLPVAIDNGFAIPGTLTASAQTMAYRYLSFNWQFVRNTTASLASREWMMWNVLAPARARYNFAVSTGGGGTFAVILDNQVIGTYTSGTLRNVAVTLTPGLHSLRIRSNSGTFNVTNVVASQVTDPTPTLQTFKVNDGTAQRSKVNTLGLTFSEQVTLNSPLILQDRAGNYVSGVSLVVTPSGDGRNFLVSFEGPAIAGGSLPDGLYRVTTVGTELYDSSSLPMNGIAVNSFHRLFGDSDGDRDVDSTDLYRFRQSLNRPANYRWYFDYEDNATINNADYLQFRQRLTRSVLR